METITMVAKYKTSVKEPGIPGVLKMMEDRFVFAPNDPRLSMNLNVDFRQIKGHKFSKDGSKQALLNLTQDPEKGGGYIFEFNNFPDRNACRDFVGKVLGRFQSAEKPPASRQAEQLSTKELERRMKLLTEDSELQNLHKQLVASGILMDSEFWAARKSLLDNDNYGAPKQRAGFKSAMLADVKPLADGRDHGILRDGSKETVEGDNEFSRRTLSQDLNRHGSVVLEGRTLDVELGDTRTVAEALARSKQGLSTENSDENVHMEKSERVCRMTEIEDLQAPRSFPVAPLCIKDPREYFDSQQANALKTLGDNGTGMKPMDCNLSAEEAWIYLIGQISQVKVRGFNHPIVQSEAALKVLNGLNQNLSSTKYQFGKNSQESVLDRLPRKIKDDLLNHWSTIQELLRHFWSSYPITAEHLSKKVGRLKDAMTEIYVKLQEIKESVQGDFRHQVSLLVQPMVQEVIRSNLKKSFTKHMSVWRCSRCDLKSVCPTWV
ncbi:general transcription and DNA repair factor IIH subunit TFB1-1-like isoform X3 [Dioscorea cayenensis subsp. rotundata]|uniref:General transcription and DNA repair factor IIH subunit TFB1-1-like isoform X3 n=1 Tax=Dioscorea cayennensis subsp. rotundata TaxID=55577 RepID=A0AB40C032_DIOCR|nr:general transcription and DNA repair factor IIH subunit TFB1-1-like isoform X3 [Dioscorea cayenensis subsp. rotundata]